MSTNVPRPFWTVQEYGEVTEQQYRDLKTKTEIDWAAINKSMRETIYKGLARPPQPSPMLEALRKGTHMVKQTPFESEWHRLLKQSQVQQEASKPMPALVQTTNKTPPIDVPNVKVAMDAIESRKQKEHIWNMIVLAAESSRYNT